MSSKPSIEELEEGLVYEKVLTLSYRDIAPFVIERMRRLCLPTIAVWSVAGTSLFLIILYWPGMNVKYEDPQTIKGLAYGLIVMPLLLIPFHEGLHLVPFRLAGAKDIRIGADLRQGIIYVTANRFVAGLSLFSAVALTPFITITAGLAAAILFSPPWWQWTLSMTLFTHTTMCIGDAILLGYMTEFKSRGVFTWDDADKGEAYFYAGKNTENNVQHKKYDT